MPKKLTNWLNGFSIVFVFLVLFQTIFAGGTESADFSGQIHTNSVNSKGIDNLEAGVLRLREIAKSERHLYKIQVKAGNCLRFIVNQISADVIISIKDETGNVLKKTDRPSGASGRETVTLLTEKTQPVIIEIAVFQLFSQRGKYQISYTETSQPEESDRLRNLAENLTTEGEDLRSGGSLINKEEALKKFSEALIVWQKLEDVYEQAVVYYGIGFTNHQISKFFEAARNFHKALKLHQITDDDFGKAVNLAALGSTQYVLNENEFAAYNYRKAIEIFKKINSPRNLAIAFHGLGTAEMLLENYQKAITDLNESLYWREAAGDSTGKVYTFITLGKIFFLLKNNEKADQNLSEAESILGAENAAKDSEILYYRGKYYLQTGKFEIAENYLDRSLTISRERGNRLGEANVLLDLSQTYFKLNKIEAALETIQKALFLVESLRQSALDFRQRINFTETIQPFYEQYISFLMRLHEREPQKRFDQKALEISEQSRARGLLDQLERRNFIRQKLIDPVLLEKENLLRDKLTSLLSWQNENKWAEIADEFQTVSAQFAEVEVEINEQFNKFDKSELPIITIQNIQDQLSENTVLAEYLLTGEESFLWLVSKNSVDSFRLTAGSELEKIAKNVYQCNSAINSPSRNKICHQQTKKLSEILLKPIAEKIGDRRLLVVKHGFLHYISFAALVNPKTEKYLLESNEIVNLSSVTLLKFIQNSPKTPKPQKTLAIFADPVYSATDERLSPKKNPNIEPTNELVRLFASRFEAWGISRFATAESLLINLDFEAGRQRFLDSGLNDFRYLHFATHALINDREPQISSIALSFFDKEGKAVNGRIYPSDVLSISLNSELTVLSACRSGAGKQVKGEGIISFSQSFISAGTKKVLLSLWNVDDKVTAELMVKFYKSLLLDKKNSAAALREAQIKILNDDRWKQPFYWGAFILEGEE